LFGSWQTLLLLLFILSFGKGCFRKVEKIDHLQEAQLHLKQGNLALENKKYDEAIAWFEKASHYSQQLSPADQNLSQQIRSRVKQTKAKSLIDHFNSSSDRNVTVNSDLLPSTLEAKDFHIIQHFGDIVLSRKWTTKKVLKHDSFLGVDRKLTVHSQAGLEIRASHTDLVLRTIGPSGFVLEQSNSLYITSGVYFLTGGNNKPNPLSIEFPLGKLEVLGKGEYALFLEITTNGGCKLIGLTGEPELILTEEELQELLPGELIFVTADGFSRKMNIELSTFIASSSLISAFKEPPGFAKKLRQNALIQAIRTRKHFRVLVGDAKNEKDFEIKILNESSENK
jgi:hypothetical protein